MLLTQPQRNQCAPYPLNEIEIETCRMRFEGYTSREIEVRLAQLYGPRAPREKTIRSWFARSGRLRVFYQSYAAEEARDRQIAARYVLSAHVRNAARVLVQLMLDPSRSDWIRFRAAQYIINRELGLPPKTVSRDETKDPTTRILEMMGIIEDKI